MANKKITVLCAEDEQEIRDNIAEILQDEGFEVLQAENGKDALNIFLEKRPNIIVSDIMMPEMSGYDLLKLIRENDKIPNNNVPFIFLTALGQKDNVVKGADLMANDYLVKPIDFDLLIAKIKEKVGNVARVQEGFNKKIDNIKDQVSVMMPTELTQYVDIITQISKVLKDEPYGPFPHKKYIDDLNKIYLNSTKLRSVISNFISGDAIAGQLISNDEIIDPAALLEDFVAKLNPKFIDRIKLSLDSRKNLPRIKIDKNIMIEAIKKIVSGLLKMDDNIEIGLLSDHLNRLVLVFYPTKEIDEKNLNINLDKEGISKILDSQGCSFEVLFKGSEASMLLYIPAHRVVSKSA
jgi:CheY-like chemotaxis protein